MAVMVIHVRTIKLSSSSFTFSLSVKYIGKIHFPCSLKALIVNIY